MMECARFLPYEVIGLEGTLAISGLESADRPLCHLSVRQQTWQEFNNVFDLSQGIKVASA
jgi:hypothetical protein